MSNSATANFADASDNQMEEGVRECCIGIEECRKVGYCIMDKAIQDENIKCTCPPSERPEPCMKKYALSDCHKAASTAWAAKVIQEECDKVEKSNEPR